MAPISLEDLTKCVINSDLGGLVVDFSPQNFKTISYFLHEFAVDPEDPKEQIGAFRMGDVLVVGKRWFLESLWTEM